MITLTALVALLGLGWVLQYAFKRAVVVARKISESKPVVGSVAPTKA